MKKIILGLFVLASLTLTTACSSDDDAGGGTTGELVVTIDGETVTFTSIVVVRDTYTDTDDGTVYNDLDVTATIGGDTPREIYFGVESGDTGENAHYAFDYIVDGVEYYENGGFTTNVTVNNGSSIVMSFSGVLMGYENGSTTPISLTLENGSVSVNF